MNPFHTQGAVPLDSTSYMSRSFEQQIFEEITSKRWVLLLGPRQHGKTSSLIRLRRQLQDLGFYVARIDLQGLPPCESFEQLLKRVTDQLCKSLSLPSLKYPIPEDRDDLLSWLRINSPEDLRPIVVMIDEAASIDNPLYRNSFYGQIRQISSLRAEASESDIPARVSFIFSGTFRPETLVHENNSPFNVCQLISTNDLPIESVRDMIVRVFPPLNPYVDLVYGHVGGQPYLLQYIFAEAVRQTDISLEDAIQQVLLDLRNLASQHLEGIFSKIITNSNLTQKIASILEKGSVPLIPADGDCNFLINLGIAKRNAATLKFRNKLYLDTARESPQITTTTTNNSPQCLVFNIDKLSFTFMQNHMLFELAYSAYSGGAKAHNAGNFRLALVGFGSAMEAILLDVLLSLSPTNLQTAVNAAQTERDHSKRPNFNSREIPTDPITWNLVTLINVARKTSPRSTNLDPSHALREWRNLVHPAVAIRDFIDESELEPESVAAAAMIVMLIRDITT